MRMRAHFGPLPYANQTKTRMKRERRVQTKQQALRHALAGNYPKKIPQLSLVARRK
jgi:hypothetical protein